MMFQRMIATASPSRPKKVAIAIRTKQFAGVCDAFCVGISPSLAKD
jgi:hypothetical protein